MSDYRFNIVLSFITLFTMLFTLSSCKKPTNYKEPEVEIITPYNNQSFTLPGIVNIHFVVKHDSPIEYIRVSIDNKSIIAVSENYYFDSIGNVFEGNIGIPVGILSEHYMKPPFYVHIAVSDYNELNHTYLKIDLNNSELEYSGLFVVHKHAINELGVDYYNQQFNKKYTFNTDGNFKSASISSSAKLLYVASTIPDKVVAFSCIDGEKLWIKEPQLPYPEFNTLTVNDNKVYASTEIGRVIGLNGDVGTQVFSTEILRDTIPYNVCFTKDYLIANFRLRNSSSKVWVSFYKETGKKYRVKTTNFETVDIYEIKNENSTVMFCNSGSSGQIIKFNVESNSIERIISIDDIEIDNSFMIDKSSFLFSSNNCLYHFMWESEKITKIFEFSYSIVDIEYNKVDNELLIAFYDKVLVFSYPDMNLVKSVGNYDLIEDIEARYSY